MALKMETGTANGQLDFLNKIKLYVQNVATEWTFKYKGAILEDTSNTVLTLGMGTSCNFSIKARVSDTTNQQMFVNPHKGYTAGAFYNQPQCPRNNTPIIFDEFSFSVPVTDTFTYWLFSDTTYFYIVAKMVGGFYITVGFGQLATYISGDHGYFVYGSSDSGYMAKWDALYFPTFGYSTGLPSAMGSFAGFTGPNYNAQGCMGACMTPDGKWRKIDYSWGAGPNDGVNSNMRFANTNNYYGPADANRLGLYPICDTADVNIMAPLMPKVFVAPHPTLTGKMYHYGQINGAFAINTRLIPEETEITIGTDHYLVFPACKTRNIPSRFAQYAGIAIKKPTV